MLPEPGASGGWSEPWSGRSGRGCVAASRARRSLRRIFPAADLGIASTNSTARTFLYGATRSGDERRHLRGGEVGAGRGTTKALGDLLALGVAHADDRRVRDPVVGEQHRLQLGRRPPTSPCT